VEAYYKYSERGRIGMKVPPAYVALKDGPSLPLWLKPIKYPKNLKASKKVYKEKYLLRSKDGQTHIYSIEENLYIVSLQGNVEVKEWIDKNENKIKERICMMKEF
jgi:hypothetical protein